MITLSIVSHRQGALVAELLRDLDRIDSRLVRAIVVTRNVDEMPIDVPRRLASLVTTIDNARPRGFGANHNAAFARCTTPFFTVLNPDIRLVDDPFPPIVARFDDGGAALGLVAPRIIAPDGRDEDAARKLITPYRLLEHRIAARERRPVADFDWLAGMFMTIRSDAYREVGGFDERYFLYCEDFDLCARLQLAGRRLAIADRISVVHAAQRASHRSVKHLAWHFVSLWKMWTSSTFWRYRRAFPVPLR